jgi:hypothetical protein
MTPQEAMVWKMVHDWCDAQGHDIPDFNRRLLMDKILELIKNYHDKTK